MPSPIWADVIIPSAPYHQTIAQDAIDSALALGAVRCLHVVDKRQAGAGLARNVGIRYAQAPFSIFLDADDVISPDFLSATLHVWRPSTWVYTDWHSSSGVDVKLPDSTCHSGWGRDIFHLITCLVPTYLAKQFPFNHVVGGGEDNIFYANLCHHGYKGIRANTIGLTYRHEHSKRSKMYVNSGEINHVRRFVKENLKMGCCGSGKPSVYVPAGDCLDSDIQARTLWNGNQKRNGAVTRRVYRGGNGRVICMDREDALAEPRFYEVIESALVQTLIEPQLVLVQQLAGILHDDEDFTVTAYSAESEPVSSVEPAKIRRRKKA